MNNITEVAKAQAELARQIAAEAGPSGIVVVSIPKRGLIEHRAGVKMEARPPLAAKLIINETHRAATEDEVLDFKRELRQRTDLSRQQEMERKEANGQIAYFQNPAALASPAPPSFEPVAPAPAEPRRGKQ